MGGTSHGCIGIKGGAPTVSAALRHRLKQRTPVFHDRGPLLLSHGHHPRLAKHRWGATMRRLHLALDPVPPRAAVDGCPGLPSFRRVLLSLYAGTGQCQPERLAQVPPRGVP